MAQADQAIEEVLVKRAFGGAGANIVIQELLEGMEISLHALCDGKTAKLFPTAQDHKRALDGDLGLNTGGMGAYSPAPFLSGSASWPRSVDSILDPWLRGCAAEGIDFHGILYPGVMLTQTGPKVLEFNARFGDPETQVYLTRLENDLVELLAASIDGTLGKMELKWNPMPSVCVVMASAGYPGSYAKGKPIRGLDEAARLPNTKVFHAGTANAGDQIVTSGGRVLGVTAWAKDLQQRARCRLCGGGNHPLRGRPLPPRHRRQGAEFAQENDYAARLCGGSLPGRGRPGQACEVAVAGLLGLVHADLERARVSVTPNFRVAVGEIEHVAVIVAMSGHRRGNQTKCRRSGR